MSEETGYTDSGDQQPDRGNPVYAAGTIGDCSYLLSKAGRDTWTLSEYRGNVLQERWQVKAHGLINAQFQASQLLSDRISAAAEGPARDG